MYDYPRLQYKTLHSRYSELAQINSPHSALRVARKRIFRPPELAVGRVEFGRIRHRMFDRESKTTSRLPAIIADNLELPNDMKQSDIESEVYLKAKIPGVGWIHSTIDGLLRPIKSIVDYKTTQGEVDDFDPYQLYVYALVCIRNGIDIDKAWLLAEQWDDKRTKILGYDSALFNIGPAEIDKAHGWLKNRAKLLKDVLAIIVPIHQAIKDSETKSKGVMV